ncbi:MAG TPA: gamma-glutamylcyclotransferase [Azospirillaceae bacterium]|nr:gamma-glutamylcyclotransferase [Azospirillaceae bacterium]
MLTRDLLREGAFKRLLEQTDGARTTRLLTDDERAASLAGILAEHPCGQDAWVFGYGSLIWNPAMHTVESRSAILIGWHRRFCLWSPLGRGTLETPGLMLGLEPGGSCRGVVHRIAAAEVATELDLLWRREMLSGAYVPRWVGCRTPGGPVRAITFTINHAYPRYAGRLTDEQVAASIAQAAGPLGSCREYLDNTVEHLAALGIRDRHLHGIQSRVRRLCGGSTD